MGSVLITELFKDLLAHPRFAAPAKMKIPTVENFCCTNLRTGTLVIGVLCLIGSLIGSGVISKYIYDQNQVINPGPGPDVPDYVYNFYATNMGFGVTGLIICVGNFIAVCLLIHGVREANQVLVIPWIVLTIISLIFGLANLIRSIHSLVLYIGLGSTFWSTLYAAAVLGLLLIGALRVFFFVVVWSHRKNILESTSVEQI